MALSDLARQRQFRQTASAWAGARDAGRQGGGSCGAVGQHLQYLLAQRPNRELTYWLREGRSNNAEVDFVVEFQGEVIPIEVKAGRAGALKSLHQFVAERAPPLAVRFDALPPNLQDVEMTVRSTGGRLQRVCYRLLSLPLYLVERLPELVGSVPAAGRTRAP